MIRLFTEVLPYVWPKMNEIPVNVIINKRNKISNELREMIIRNMDNGMCGEQVAKLVGRKGHTMREVYRKYLKTGLKRE